MCPGDAVERQPKQPGVEWHRTNAQVMREPSGGDCQCLLDHVRRVQPRCQSAVQPGRDHATQAIPVRSSRRCTATSSPQAAAASDASIPTSARGSGFVMSHAPRASTYLLCAEFSLTSHVVDCKPGSSKSLAAIVTFSEKLGDPHETDDSASGVAGDYCPWIHSRRTSRARIQTDLLVPPNMSGFSNFGATS